MANDLNQCNFIGRLGRDPETRYTPDGKAITSFSIAVGSNWTDKSSGEKKEDVEWVRVVTFNKLAEICGEYLKKGGQVYICGRMKTRKWQDKEGQDRYTTEIIADHMQMLGSKRDGTDHDPQPNATGPRKDAAKPADAVKPRQTTGGKFDDMADDIPF